MLSCGRGIRPKQSVQYMHNLRWTQLQRVLTLLAAVLVVKVTISIVLEYRLYFPANFASDFLRGRESHFTGNYQWAFYAHILCGPCSLILGLLLMSESFRIRFQKWHRRLGKIQIALVVLVLAPSGLWMAPYAQTGLFAAIGFSGLAIATECCALFGWRSAVKRQFAAHRLWMQRCFLLLCSAVVLRLIGGLTAVTHVGVTWSYPLAAWASWIVPLALFELGREVHRTLTTRAMIGAPQNLPSAAALSLPAIDINARR